MKFMDTLVNLAAQLGTGKSKQSNDAFYLLTREPTELAAIYRGDWIGRKIVDAPIFDMLREWRAWQAEPNLIDHIEAAEDHHKLAAKVSRAARLGALFGGGAIIIGADTANPEKALIPASIKRGGLKYLTVLSRYAFNTPEIDLDPRSPTFGSPKWYELKTDRGDNIILHPRGSCRSLAPIASTTTLCAPTVGRIAACSRFTMRSTTRPSRKRASPS